MLKFSFYTDVYGGRIIKQDDWMGLDRQAEQYISHVCNLDIPSNLDDYVSDSKCMAVATTICELADMYAKLAESDSHSGISSESTDGYSVSYEKQSMYDTALKKMNIVREGLAYTGLMYPCPCRKSLVIDEIPGDGGQKEMRVVPKMIFYGKISDDGLIKFNEPVYPPCKITMLVRFDITQDRKITKLDDIAVTDRYEILTTENAQIPENSFQMTFPVYYSDGVTLGDAGTMMGYPVYKDFISAVNSADYGLQMLEVENTYYLPTTYQKLDEEHYFKPVDATGRNAYSDTNGLYSMNASLQLYNRSSRSWGPYCASTHSSNFGLGYSYSKDIKIYSEDADRMAFYGLKVPDSILDSGFLSEGSTFRDWISKITFKILYEKVE